MEKALSKMKEVKLFCEELDKILDKNHPCYESWKKHVLSGVSRGVALVSSILQYNVGVFNKVALDLGCGCGGLSIALAKHGSQVISLDKSKKLLKMARFRALEECLPKPNLVLGCGEKLPLRSQVFDIVFCIEWFIGQPPQRALWRRFLGP